MTPNVLYNCLCIVQEALQAPNPAFSMLQIADLIPSKLREAYSEAGGAGQ